LTFDVFLLIVEFNSTINNQQSTINNQELAIVF